MNKYIIFFISVFLYNPVINSINSINSIKNLWPKSETEIVNKEYKLEKNSETKSFSFKIDNLYGSIKIFGWNQDTVKIHATKTGSEDKIKNTKINISPDTSFLKISTNITADNKPATIDYIINVPEDALIDISTNKGDIEIIDVFEKTTASTSVGNIKIKNARASVEAHTGTGNIDIILKTVTPKNSILLDTIQGDIKLFLPNNSNATVFAKTNNGEVISEHPITLEPKTVTLNKETWNQFKKEAIGNFGDGGAPITIDTNKGNINFIVSSNS